MDFNSLLINIPLALLSIVLLWKGSDWVVTSASKFAHAWGISDLVIGLTIVAIGTSAPEFAVTISAVLTGKADISVSNIVGSNIFNLGFILGGTASFYAIATTPKLVYRDGFFLIGVTILLSFFLFDFQLLQFDKPITNGVMTRWEGATLLTLLIVYMTYLFFKREDLGEEISHEKASWKDGLLLIAGLASVVYGGHLLVESASTVARFFGVSDWVIGVTIVAAGTSAPELATSITALLRGKSGMAIGNLIGSDLFNLLGVLGLAAILKHPLNVSLEARSSMIMLVLMVMLVVYFMRSGWKITRLQGFSLVIINLVRWVFDFMGKAG
ncbi:MAG: sodium:calcium antiporter [Deltaproteobacteria bacterium]|jgi:cation:H+ antiporter|nr:sodium:calcium antiporter [Deltaproteobacteria bacterium]MBT4089532.1 sodium:calcium antiporter [Deltaproteobacteria bacterium]MBT4268101.1 sodium:calcium antiporter [Deltaproteobacteria bacterium]MBT4640270.1 sodium:calcium antiporter [Deltaproteobacteria bacterium]MBT6502966.1 sodium:calcium antiporter [Deltaproteobacteria bacterium]